MAVPVNTFIMGKIIGIQGLEIDIGTHINTISISTLFLNIHINFHSNLRVTVSLEKLCIVAKHGLTSRCEHSLHWLGCVAAQPLYRFSVLCSLQSLVLPIYLSAPWTKIEPLELLFFFFCLLTSYSHAAIFKYCSRKQTHLIHELKIYSTCFTVWGMICWNKEKEKCQSFLLSS